MPASQVAAVQKALQTTSEWLVRIMQGLDTSEAEQAYAALRVTLHALRDGLPPAGATLLGSQLPLLMRGIYYEGWKVHAPPTQTANADGFLPRMARELGETDAESRARVVLRVLAREITTDGFDVRGALPECLHGCWR